MIDLAEIVATVAGVLLLSWGALALILRRLRTLTARLHSMMGEQ